MASTVGQAILSPMGKRDEKPVGNITEKQALSAGAVTGAAVGLLLVLLQSSGGAGPPVAGDMGSGASATTGFMIVLIPVITAWALSVNLRCSDAVVRRNLELVAAMLVLWLIVVMVKYPMRSNIGASIMWYSYYIPMTLIPTLCLLSALRAAALDRRPWVAATRRALVLLDVLAIALVLTNNLHHWVFDFDFANPMWAGDYAYMPGYWCLCVFYIAEYASSMAVLFAAARRNLRSALVPIAVVGCIAAAYSMLYVLRHAMSVGTNLAMAYSVMLVVALEAALDLKILPSYLWYGEVFANLPFDLKILSRDGHVVHQTNMSAPIDDAEMEIMSRIRPNRGTTVSKRTTSGSGAATAQACASAEFQTTGSPAAPAPTPAPAPSSKLFKVYPISGGTVLLAEDVSNIDGRRTLLMEQQDELKRSNELLMHDVELKRKLSVQSEELDLLEDIQRSLSEKTARIEELLADLPQEDDEASERVRRERLMEVKLLVAYCKRKGALAIAERSDPDFDRERLQLLFAETSSDLRSIGIDSAVMVDTFAVLPVQTVSVLYDCLYDFAGAAFDSPDPILLMFVRDDASDGVELRAALEVMSDDDGILPALASGLREHLAQHSDRYSIEEDSRSLKLVATMAGSGA